jgi:hypothetical protein
MVRAFAALATDTTNPTSFAATELERLDSSWKLLQVGVRHAMTLLIDEVGLGNSTLLPSANALVPIVYYLGTRQERPLDEQERRSLIHWLLVVFMQARYSSSAATVIAQDVAALRSGDPFRALFGNLGLLEARPEVTPAVLAGKGSTSPYFLLSYLATRTKNARDWWYGTPVTLSHDGTYKVEYHHIHPRARLRATYSKAEINDLANLAFISDKANRKISARSPAVYFEDLEKSDADYLTDHLIPTDPALRTADAYPEFVAHRRAMLATAMNELLDAYRPEFLDAVARVPSTAVGAQLDVTAYGTSTDAGDIVLVITSSIDERTTYETLNYAALDTLLTDLADGLGGELEVGGDTLAFDAETELIAVPFGCLNATGTIQEWRKVLDRELGDLRPLSEMPHVAAEPWEGARHEFAVLDSE